MAILVVVLVAGSWPQARDWPPTATVLPSKLEQSQRFACPTPIYVRPPRHFVLWISVPRLFALPPLLCILGPLALAGTT